MANRRLLGERVAVRVAGCPTRDGVLISGVKKETKLIQKFHVRFPNGDVRTHRGDQILLRGSRAPLTEFVRVGDIIFTKNTLGVVRFVGKHEDFTDTLIVMEPVDPKLPTDPNVKSFRKLFPSANLSDQNSYNILTKAEDILKMLPPDSILKQISGIKDKYLAFVEERKEKDKQYSEDLTNADNRITLLENFKSQMTKNMERQVDGVEDGNDPGKAQSVTFTFEPGRLGIRAVWTTGKVEGVSEGTQAERLGVVPGWKITHVGNEAYTEEVLDAHTDGSNAFTLTFEVSPAIVAQQALAFPKLDEIGESWNIENPNVPARPMLSPEAKEEYEQKITDLSGKIKQSQDFVMDYEAKNAELEEKQKEITKLRVKVENLRNSRVMFMSQIKQITNRGKEWREKAMEWEKKYQKLLEERGMKPQTEEQKMSPSGTISSQGPGVGKGNNIDKSSGQFSSGTTKRRKNSSRIRMPKPEPGNTLSLQGFSATTKKKKKRTSWFKDKRK